MRSIRKENAKKILFYLIMSICLFMVMANTAKASKGTIDNPALEIDHRRIEYHNKTYDLYINHKEKFISVHGPANDWKEEEKIEKYIRLVTPRDYEIAFDIEYCFDQRS